MNTLSSFTLYIILATIIPGFITISLLLGIYYSCNNSVPPIITSMNEGLFLIIVFAIVFINQILGIALEKLLDKTGFFPKEIIEIDLPEKDKSTIKRTFKVNPSSVYDEMYVILSRLGKDHDVHGHVQRVVGQFFLTLNSLVSYIISFVFLFISSFILKCEYCSSMALWCWIILLLFLFAITLIVVRLRFKIMVKALYTANYMADISIETK